MVSVSITLMGGKQVMAKLEELNRLTSDHIEEIAVGGALPIANKAKELARYKTGTLRRSIHIGGHSDLTPDCLPGADLYPYTEVRSPETTEDSSTVFVGTNVVYAAIIEFGGPGRISAAAKTAQAKYGGGSVGGNYRRAYPYLRPARDDPEVQRESRETMQLMYHSLILRTFGGAT